MRKVYTMPVSEITALGSYVLSGMSAFDKRGGGEEFANTSDFDEDEWPNQVDPWDTM